MKCKGGLKAAGALAVAGGVVLGAGSWVQATESVGLQIATAEQTAAVKQRQELMKSIGGYAKAITEYLKASKGTKEEAAAADAKNGELAKLGRETGRERVGQYVAISGVAGYVKKKKQK